MNRSDITELHYISPIENIPSILKHGILSHNRAKKINHYSVAMLEIQERRKDKQIPGAGICTITQIYISMHTIQCSANAERIIVKFVCFALIPW
jgi:hypothetical protein